MKKSKFKERPSDMVALKAKDDHDVDTPKKGKKYGKKKAV
jgi:hypothetical protein